MQDTLLGIAVTILAGLVMGTSPWPLKLMHRFEYEHFAFISMLTALIVIPWTVVLSCCPHAYSAYAAIDTVILLKSNLFSLGFGVAQILAMMCFIRIGVSLTYGILTAVGASLGVITPMIFKGSGLFQQAPNITSTAGMTILLGVAVMLVGVLFASLSGFGREKSLPRDPSSSGGFVVGLLIVIVAGVLSTGLSFAFVYSQGPIVAAMKSNGAGDIPANFAVWAIGLLGAALINVLYPAFLMTKNRSWIILVGNGREALLSAVYGAQFCAAIALVGKGMLLLGALGASVGWGTQQAMQLIGGQILGFIAGEWRGVTGKPRRQIYTAVAVLLVSMFIMALGNALIN